VLPPQSENHGRTFVYFTFACVVVCTMRPIAESGALGSPKPPASPNDDASVLHLRPPVRSQSIGVRSSEQLPSLGRQPTCQCARQFPHHAETPPSVRGPLNLPCHRNRRQGLIKRKIEVSYQLDSIRNGRRLDARRARFIVYQPRRGKAKN
jgi:hypothetical protein